MSIPKSTRKNGTLYVHAFLYPQGKNHMSSAVLAHTSVLITTYALPQAVFINLLGEDGGNKVCLFLSSPSSSFSSFLSQLEFWGITVLANILDMLLFF